MKHTHHQTLHRTLTDLYRALDRKQPVTLTYRDRNGDTTIRTIEPIEFRTTAGGGIILIAMCRLRAAEGQPAEREFRITAISAYTIHRGRYTLTRPEPTTYQHPATAPADDAQALVSYELARDKDDADHQPRIRLTQTTTGLAA